MKQSNENAQNNIKFIQSLLNNPYSKYVVAILGGMLALFIGGKLMRLFAGVILDYKMLKSAIKV
jgi:hypothetical protein